MTEREKQEEYLRRTRHLDVAKDEALAEAVRILKEITGKAGSKP